MSPTPHTTQWTVQVDDIVGGFIVTNTPLPRSQHGQCQLTTWANPNYIICDCANASDAEILAMLLNKELAAPSTPDDPSSYFDHITLDSPDLEEAQRISTHFFGDSCPGGHFPEVPDVQINLAQETEDLPEPSTEQPSTEGMELGLVAFPTVLEADGTIAATEIIPLTEPNEHNNPKPNK